DRPNLEKYAQELGLDMAKFKAALDSGKFKAQIEAEQKLVVGMGAGGTPGFFINGRKLMGAQPIEKFKEIIDEELKKADALLASGVRAENLYATIIEKGAARQAEAPPAQAERPSAPPPSQVKKIDVPAWSPVKGPKAAKVTIVEWSDFQCPFCNRATNTLKQVAESYGNDVRIVFRHQPLSFHQNALPAAKASMAAHRQGKFWPMHDKLFEHYNALSAERYEAFAKELGLDLAKFKADMENAEIADQIQKDSAEGNSVGANGTPTFFVNGRKLEGAQPLEAFKSLIDQEIKEADALLAKGVKLEQVYERRIEDAANAPGVKIDLTGAPIKGSKKAQVTIVEFSDFQCPFCGRVNPTLKQIQETYGDKVAIAFKQFPLGFHDKAQLAGEASLAAHEQGKFWEMHDKLFANQNALDRSNLEQYAKELGLDLNKFKAALDSGKYRDQVQKDMQQGQAAGVSGPPSFVINGELLVGAQP
ncbi:MAG: DsbA family protein, partial [Myxococcales bacterium]